MFSKMKRVFAARSRKSTKYNRQPSGLAKCPSNAKTSPTNNNRAASFSCTRLPRDFVTGYGLVPRVLVNAAKIVTDQLDVKGLFQTQGSLERINQLMNALTRFKPYIPSTVSVHDVAEVIKVYLTRLSPTVVPDEVMKLLIGAHQSQDPNDYTNALLRFRELSPDIVPSVHFVLSLFKQVSENSQANGMDTGKMATIFVIDIMKLLCAVDNDGDYETSRLHQVQKLPYDIMAIEHLIKNVHLFEEQSLVAGTGNNTGGRQKNDTKEFPLQDHKLVSNVKAESNGRPSPPQHAPNSPPPNANTVNDMLDQVSGIISPAGYSTRTKSPATTPAKSPTNSPTRPLQYSRYHSSASKPSSGEHKSNSPVRTPFKELRRSLSPKSRKGPPPVSLKRATKTKGQHQHHETQQSCIDGNQERQKLALPSSPTANDNPVKTGPVGHPKEQHEQTAPKRHLRQNRQCPIVKKGKRKNIKGKMKPSATHPQCSRTIFRKHEELLPWSVGQLESDDSSNLMSMSILNPHSFRFLDEHHLTVGPRKDTAETKVKVEVDYTIKTKKMPDCLSDDNLIKTACNVKSCTSDPGTEQANNRDGMNPERVHKISRRCNRLHASGPDKVDQVVSDQQPESISQVTVPDAGDNPDSTNKRIDQNPNWNYCCKRSTYSNFIKIQRRERRVVPKPKWSGHVGRIVDTILAAIALLCIAYVLYI